MAQPDYRIVDEFLDAWALGLVNSPTMDKLAALLSRPPQTVDDAVKEILYDNPK